MFNDWHPIRWIFLVVGFGLAYLAYTKQDFIIGFLAFIIAYQAIMNVGCIKHCYPKSLHSSTPAPSTSDEITYEEIL